MIGAIVRENQVENLIVIDEKNVEALATALACEIVDARPWGLIVGDLRTERGWTRNAGGEQMVLQPLEARQYDGYTLAVEQLETAGETAGEEALAILEGMDET